MKILPAHHYTSVNTKGDDEVTSQTNANGGALAIEM